MKKAKYDYLFIKDHEMIMELNKHWNLNKDAEDTPKQRPKRESTIKDISEMKKPPRKRQKTSHADPAELTIDTIMDTSNKAQSANTE